MLQLPTHMMEQHRMRHPRLDRHHLGIGRRRMLTIHQNLRPCTRANMERIQARINRLIR